MFGFGKPKKNAVLIIPQKNYDDHELADLEKSLSQHGIKYTVASAFNFAPIEGIYHHKIKPEISCADIAMDKIDALVFIGGDGARDSWNDFALHRLIQLANQKGKIIGAIDYAVLILAHAEILNKRKATVINLEEHKLAASGAIYTGNPVEVDGNIITADVAAHVKEFGDKFAQVLTAH